MKGSRLKLGALAAVVVAGVAAAVGATAARGANTTIVVWDWGSPPPSAFKALDTAYMKSHPGVVIKRVHQPFNSYFTLMRTAIATHKGPDIFENYASPFIFDYVQGLQPLDKLVKPADRKNLIGWNYVSSNLSNTGTPYALPWSGQGIHFYYNKALFKKAGLNPNKPPKTWAAFLADCAKLKKAGIVPIVAGFKDGYYAEWLTDVLSMQFVTRQQLEASYSKPNWTSPSITKALGMVVSLYKKGYMTPHSDGIPLFPDTVNNFGSGKGAMFVGLSANNANYSEFRKDKVSPNLGAFLPPLVPGAKVKQQPFDFGPGLSWAIARWSKNSTQAYNYLSWLASAQSQDKIFKLSGTFPNNKLAHPATSDKVGQEILGWVHTHPTYVGQVTLIRSNVESVFDKLIPDVVTGRTSVASAMGQVQSEQERATPIPTH